MRTQAMMPLIDLVFLTLGSVLAAMTQMERVTALPVELARVGQGAVVVQQGEFDVLVMKGTGIFLNDEPVDPNALRARLTGRRVVLRVERDLTAGRMMETLAMLHEVATEVSLEVSAHPTLRKE